VRGLGNQGYNTGCHYAVMSVLTPCSTASSGRGQFVDVSLHAAANVTTEMASYAWLVKGDDRAAPDRATRGSAADAAETQVRCADGRYANTGVPPRTPKEFGAMLGWLRELGLEDASRGGVPRDGRELGGAVRPVAARPRR
jgi:crotonobetainyl-CoA:carnitine CoA-transferase CaiB-like acyl-CoA transferase